MLSLKDVGGYLTFCVVLGLFPGFLCANQTSPTYEIGGIPPQVAWHGEVLTFSVSANLGSSVTFSMSAKVPPVGPITLSSATGIFSYSPDVNDLSPFNIKITADGEGKEISQTFRIKPSFKAEYGLIGRGVPKASEDEITISEVRHEEEEFFNGSTEKRKRKSLSVSGKTVIVDTVAPHNKVYQLYSYTPSNKVDNIREAAFYAETLIIRAPLKLPQTNVTIYARELRFEGNGAIDTTPLSDWKDADSPKNGPEKCHCKSKDFTDDDRPTPGWTGNDAGQIALHINHFSTEGPLKRFVMRGGVGQPGGPGHDGRDGKDLAVLSPEYGAVFIDDHGTPHGEKNWPEDGCDAVPDGKPGNGGNGGNLFSNTAEVFPYADQGAGWTTSAYLATSHSGGRAAGPNPASWISITIERTCSGVRENRTCTSDYIVHVLDKHSSSDGKAAYRPNPDKPAGNVGQPHLFTGPEAEWLHPAIVYEVLKYAKDLYIRGYLDDAGSLVLDYSSLLAAMKERPKAFEVQFSEQELQLSNLSQRLASNLDYFGFPAGYAPLMSLEANLQLYQNEISTAIPVLYLSYWLKGKEHSLEDKRQALGEGVNKLSLDTASAVASYNSMQESVGNIQVEATNVAQRVQTTQSQLKVVEDRLEEKARSDVEAAHRLPAWKQGLGTLAVIAKVCPVYQPVLGAIGVGLDAISQIDTAKPLETAQNIKNVADQLTTANLDESYKDLRSHIQQLDPREAKGASDFINRALPVAKKIAEAQQKVAAATQVAQAPQSEIEARLNKLKAENPEFISLTKQVEELETDKERLAREIASTLQQLATTSDRIVNNVATIDALNEELNSTVASLNPRTALYLDEIERRANETLLKYHYYVAKAYEYRLLRPYPYALNLQTQFNDLLQLATADTRFESLQLDKTSPVSSQAAANKSHSAVLSPDEYARLATVYKESLEGTLKDLVDLYNSNTPERNDKFFYSLQSDELEALNAKPGRSVTINLGRLGRLRGDEENQRIASIQSEISAHKSGANPGSASVKITYTLPLLSEIRAGAGNFLFRHPDALQWETTCNFRQENTPCEKNEVKASPGTNSLMNSLLPRAEAFDSVALSEPSLRGDITIAKTVIPDDPATDIIIDKLELQIVYDYHKRQAGRVSLTVQVPAGLRPYISLSTADLNGLKDGMGDFVRDYPQNPKAKVKIAAPSIYAGSKFLGWQEGGHWVGGTLAGGTAIPAKVTCPLPPHASCYDI